MDSCCVPTRASLAPRSSSRKGCPPNAWTKDVRKLGARRAGRHVGATANCQLAAEAAEAADRFGVVLELPRISSLNEQRVGVDGGSEHGGDR